MSHKKNKNNFKNTREIDIEAMRKYFVPDFENGKIYINGRNGELREVGFLVDGRARVSFKGKQWSRSRVLYAMYHGELPKYFVIDHINGIPDDDRIDNLRLCTQTQNLKSRRMYCTNTSGYYGVYRQRQSEKPGSKAKPWYAMANIDRKLQRLGSFDDPIEAARAHDAAKIRAFGEFAKTNENQGLIDNNP